MKTTLEHQMEELGFNMLPNVPQGEFMAYAEAVRAAVEQQYVTPTGEQLYMVIKAKFASGHFPWSILSDLVKEAYEKAAADLLLSPDTIASKLIREERDAT